MKMQGIMKRLREEPFAAIEGFHVSRILDYLDGIDGLPRADVLKFFLEDGTTMVIRPSGTEPKLKAYLTIRGEDRKQLQKKKEMLISFADREIGS